MTLLGPETEATTSAAEASAQERRLEISIVLDWVQPAAEMPLVT